MCDGMLQHEVEGVDTEDKETNTECVFMPRGVKSSSQPAIVIKRSQTFSPVAKNQYICRVSHITRSSLTSWVFLWLPSTCKVLIISLKTVQTLFWCSKQKIIFLLVRTSRKVRESEKSVQESGYTENVPRVRGDLQILLLKIFLF